MDFILTFMKMIMVMIEMINIKDGVIVCYHGAVINIKLSIKMDGLAEYIKVMMDINNIQR